MIYLTNACEAFAKSERHGCRAGFRVFRLDRIDLLAGDIETGLSLRSREKHITIVQLTPAASSSVPDLGEGDALARMRPTKLDSEFRITARPHGYQRKGTRSVETQRHRHFKDQNLNAARHSPEPAGSLSGSSAV
jgi:hypothetical protein